MTELMRVSVVRSMAASAERIFAVVADPRGHVHIDGSGMLVAAPQASRLAAVGDAFRMDMDREPLGDIPIGRYDVVNTVTAFEPDRRVEWNVGAAGRTPIGHVYGYELEPLGDTGTRVTSYCDWSGLQSKLQGKVAFPVVPLAMMERTLDRLQLLVEGGTDLLERSFRPTAQQVSQPWDQLASWLSAAGHQVDDLGARQFAGGVANLNFLIRVDGKEVVLRRPPSGELAEGASDMAREWRVLSKLSSSYPLAPAGLAFCDDASVIGAPFQLLEYRPGIAVGGSLPPEWAGVEGALPEAVDDLLGAMVTLHGLDPAEAGLGELGKPDTFLSRQVDGWFRRADAAYGGAPSAEVDAIVDWLRTRVPAAPERPSLLHCDLKLDNMLLDPDTRRPVAVVDWDMTTTGDPLFDLGVLLAYWVEQNDPSEIHGLGQVPSLQAGAPSRAEVARSYLEKAGRPAQDLSFYFTLGRLRLAIAWRQLFVLHERGAMRDPKYAAFAGIADAVLAWTADTLDDSPV